MMPARICVKWQQQKAPEKPGRKNRGSKMRQGDVELRFWIKPWPAANYFLSPIIFGSCGCNLVCRGALLHPSAFPVYMANVSFNPEHVRLRIFHGIPAWLSNPVIAASTEVLSQKKM
jgi:hypothetical protein